METILVHGPTMWVNCVVCSNLYQLVTNWLLWDDTLCWIITYYMLNHGTYNIHIKRLYCKCVRKMCTWQSHETVGKSNLVVSELIWVVVCTTVRLYICTSVRLLVCTVSELIWVVFEMYSKLGCVYELSCIYLSWQLKC